MPIADEIFEHDLTCLFANAKQAGGLFDEEAEAVAGKVRVERRRTPRMRHERGRDTVCDLAEAARRFKERVDALLVPSQIEPWQPSLSGKSRKS